ncbi:MAG TPA: lactate utilization protein [Pyrinomonadaceae bacterium]|nr:lactate utilization protein [Pyrinomonadaceae bacterium]
MSEPAGEPLGSVDQREVLVRVRRALGRTVSVRPAPLEPFVEPRAAEDVEALVTRFSTELNAVGGNVYRLMSGKLQFVDELATGIADICHSTSVTKVALSGLSWLAEIALSDQLKARGLSVFMTAELGASGHEELVTQLADCGAGLTAVDYAIAETGTIVLSSDERNALLVSLLPTIHIAVLRPMQISAGLAEVISKLNVERVGQNMSCRSASFITGPSRTSDVELTLSIGVHGPKELHVIIVDD